MAGGSETPDSLPLNQSLSFVLGGTKAHPLLSTTLALFNNKFYFTLHM